MFSRDTRARIPRDIEILRHDATVNLQQGKFVFGVKTSFGHVSWDIEKYDAISPFRHTSLYSLQNIGETMRRASILKEQSHDDLPPF